MSRKLGALGLVLGALASPNISHAVSSNAVTLFGSDSAVRTPRILTPANSRFELEGGPGWFYLKVLDRRTGTRYTFSVYAGARGLVPGVHELETNDPKAHAQLSIAGEYGCDTVDGRFEIKDIAFDAQGVPTRLWMIYERSCGVSAESLFGEVRLSLPPQPGPIVTAPSIARWHSFEAGEPGTRVPVEVRSRYGAQMGRVAVRGRDPSQFVKRDDGCSWRVLPPGGTCRVWVHVIPDRPGTYWAQLRVPVAGATTHTVDLQAFVWGGSTRLALKSDPGDPIGQGVTRSFTPANAWILGSSRPFPGWGPRFYVTDRTSSEEWRVSFHPPLDEVLTAGRTYYGTTNGSLSVYPWPRVCTAGKGPFTVRNLRYDANDALRSLAIDFVQYCGSDTAAMRGTLLFRLGDKTPLAPWMVPPPSSYGPPVDMGSSP